MATVTMLVEGRAGKESWSTVTLIQDGKTRLLVDPGTCDAKALLDALARERLSAGDIDVVCLTHPHLDHTRNLGLFPDAAVLDYWGLWKGTRLSGNRKEREFSKDIRILYTPGHCLESITLLVTTAEGKVAVCGDVFWDEHGPEEDGYADDPATLEQTRTRLLELADSIMPGHGKRFLTRP